MDHESLAKDLVVGYVAGHDIPEKGEMQKIAEGLIEFYQLTKAELDKLKAKTPAPIGFSTRSAVQAKQDDDQE
jgi:hypothetical protein